MRFASLIAGFVVAAVAAAAGQAARPPAKPAAKASVPRTPDGKPDLQGVWDFAQLTPFERPGAFANKDQITDEEAEVYAQERVQNANKDRRDGGAAADVERAYNDFWWDFGTRISAQPSLVVDPKDGRVPDTTAEAKARVAQRPRGMANPEERPVAERCILGFNSGPPMVPSAYNNNVEIVQTRDRVLIHNEMIHSARVVDLTRKTHHPASMRFLTGDSIGRWEGDTLIVETRNFSQEFGFRGATKDMHLVERFTRVSPDTLRYEFTVNDPRTWVRPWSASIPMTRSSEPMFEYACHEGNIGLMNVLKGARYEDAQAAKK
jgi:hypothetical protein